MENITMNQRLENIEKHFIKVKQQHMKRIIQLCNERNCICKRGRFENALNENWNWDSNLQLMHTNSLNEFPRFWIFFYTSTKSDLCRRSAITSLSKMHDYVASRFFMKIQQKFLANFFRRMEISTKFAQ